MESLFKTEIVYFPNESVMAPLPEELYTATASNGRLADISYTVPLIVINCAFTFSKSNTEPITHTIHTISSRFLKSMI
jgi:hypothetical protein